MADSSSELERVLACRPRLPTADSLLPYLRQIDESRLYSNFGPLVLALERRLGVTLSLSTGQLLSAASGTAALVGGILGTAGRATPERPYALCPAYTFIATASALQQCGYIPYFVDVDPHSWQLEPASLYGHALLPKTGVVMPVAPLGRAVALEGWERFRQETGIPVVVDGAASLEGLQRDPARYVGRIPVALSFHATKVFATGEGGALVTTDADTALAASQALNFGFLMARESLTPSINGKMSEYHAAVGLASLDRWDEQQAASAAVAAAYRQGFVAAGLGARFFSHPDLASNYVVFECTQAAEAQAVAAALLRAGIESRLWYGEGLHRQPVFHGAAADPLPVTDRLAPRLLGLPAAPDLDLATITRIVSVILSVAG